MISGSQILDLWFTKVMWTIWGGLVILYIGGSIQWKRGKWKFNDKPK